MVKPTESYFKSHDNNRLYYQAWRANRARAVLIFVHGLNDHSGRYTYPIKYFLKHNYTLYLFDQRGHGKSDGPRSYVDKFDSYLKDLHKFCNFVAGGEKNKKIFLVGHSMGGQIVINYINKYGNTVEGFVSSSANVIMAIDLSWFKRLIIFFLSYFAPRIYLDSKINPKWLSRDLAVVRDYKRDPLVLKKTTVGLAAELMRNQESLLKLARNIRLPALVIHGGNDRICSMKGSRKFYRHLASSDKTVRIYDGYFHELFNDLGKEKVFKGINEWINRHL